MRRPMNRLMEKIVFCGLVTACRLATCPTSRSPSLVKATTEGVVRAPSAFGMTTGSPPSITATQEFVVPRSIPITFGTFASYYDILFCRLCRITCILLLFESVYFSKQFIHYLCHIAHYSNGTPILHARRANHTQ